MPHIITSIKQDCEHLLGQFLDESHYDTLIEEDTDVYLAPRIGEVQQSEDNVILMFRKNYFTETEQAGAYDGLVGAAKLSNNRGMAAGPVGERLRHLVPVNIHQLAVLENLLKLEDVASFQLTHDIIEEWKYQAKPDLGTRTLVWLGDSIEIYDWNYDRWIDRLLEETHSIPDIKNQAQWVWDTFISDTNYANPVLSGIAGYFGRYPRRPWGGPTAYTEQNFDKFKMAWPFLKTLSKGFAELLPNRWDKQYECAETIDPNFSIPHTPFTTITVNKNFRTAAHRDAGDLSTGFSNLTVVAKNKDYTGGYLILPEIRAAVNLRPGDLLLVNNHEYIHGNTPISGGEDFERLSLVCYFRENMLELGEAEYENLRHQFVESRRTNPNHPAYHEGFNGITAGMWESDEWNQYLYANDPTMLERYHPEFIYDGKVDDWFA